jgi:hypothetical protein
MIYLRWVRIDTILSEELARHGAHSLLVQLMTIPIQPSSDNHNDNNESINDAIEDLQEIAGCIAVTCQPRFPITTHPYTRHELQQRLPRTITTSIHHPKYHSFHHNCGNRNDSYNNNNNNNNNNNMNNINNIITVLIHQICTRQTAQVDVGFGELLFFVMSMDLNCQMLLFTDGRISRFIRFWVIYDHFQLSK